MAENHRSGKLAVILHADIAGSTALVQRDEQVAHDRIQDTFRRFGDIIAQYHGHVRELRGDALLAEFERASDAVSATLVFQANQDEYTAQLNDNILPMVRVGIAMGEVIVADNTVTGEGVVLAQRVEQLAEPGGLCITGAINEALPSRLPFDQMSLGEQNVKGFDEPVRVYRVRLETGEVIPPPEKPRKIKATNTLGVSAAVAAIILVIAGGVAFWLQPWVPDEEPASVERMAFPLPEKPSIAVLPLDNLSGDPNQEHLADGLTEEIITTLSKSPNLFVIARNSTFTYKGKAVEVRQVAEEQGVRYVLEGSVQRSGDRIRINAQLIDALEGHHLWAESYDREFDDIFALQDDITQNIMIELEVELTQGEELRAVHSRAPNPEAFLLLQKSRVHYNRFNKEDNAIARELAMKAAEISPDYPDAWEWMAWHHLMDFRFGWSADREESFEQALELANKAYELDPTVAGAFALLGSLSIHRRQYDEAISYFRKAVELAPSEANAIATLAWGLCYSGNPEEAIPLLKHAMRLSPIYPAWYAGTLGLGYMMTRDYPKAIAAQEQLIERKSLLQFAYSRLAGIYAVQDNEEKARAYAAELLKIKPDFNISNWSKALLYQDKEDLNWELNALRKAGLPENLPLKLPDKPSLAVLAFDNLSGDPEKEYMADGISEHIISTLARLPQLFIVSRNSTFYYKGKAVDVRQVAEELGVQYVLEGSLQTSGDSVRITAQLIDALSGLHVWSEHYDRSVDDFFALQDDITHKIAVALQVELTRGEQALIETQTTTNLRAWLKFQQGFEAYGAFTPDGNRRARKLLHEAVELDPYYAQAWTFLGWTHFIDARLGYSESRTESLTKSNELVDKAASLHPELPELYLLRAFLHMIEGELDEAIILGRKSLEVAPGSGNYHAGNAMIMLFTGEFDASIEFMQKAKRLSPLGRTWYDLTLGRAYLLKRDYESAAATFERITTEDTSPVIAAGGHTSMAVLYMETEREDKARKEIEKALSRASWLSISFYRRMAHYKDPANWQRFETALANAGLPE